jgi:hypothetical protein
VFSGGRHPVEILHPHDEVALGTPGHQPCHQRSTQIPQVQWAGRGRSESSAHSTSLADIDLRSEP